MANDTHVAAPRYAIYFAPPETSAWHDVWASWLGRSAATGALLEQPEISGIDRSRFAEMTAQPRRYGLHATLRAPVRLAPSASIDILVGAVSVYCQNQAPFALPPLIPGVVDDFVALVPAEPDRRIDAIAQSCVCMVDSIRAPLTRHDADRYRGAGLDDVEDQLLLRWGYPHVMQRFRFHLSLTGPLDEQHWHYIPPLLAAAETRLAELANTPLMFDALAVFEEREPGLAFREVARIPFSAEHA